MASLQWVPTTNAEDADADSWGFDAKAALSLPAGVEYIDTDWSTVVTRAEALDEPEDSGGVWPEDGEPALNRSYRVAERRLGQLLADMVNAYLAGPA